MQRLCVTLFDRDSHRATCIATIKQTSREEYVKSGTAFFLRDVTWNEGAGGLVLSYETIGNENDPAHHEHAPEVYRQGKGLWVLEDKPTGGATVRVRVEVR